MSNDTRKSQPIGRHPLFPALVALWFGALFGLGSLAVRVSLLESLVINSHIDAIVPQAAPPLGITARILLAAVLAIVGGILGSWIARWIARPKVEARGRRRSAQPATAATPAQSPDRQEPLAPAVEADIEEIEDASAAPAPAPAGRRRALTVQEHANQPEYMRDAAPLPGSHPQILDVTEFDFTLANAVPPQMSQEPVELDLGAFPSEHVPVTAPQTTAADTWQAEPRVVDEAFAMPTHADSGFADRQTPESPPVAAELQTDACEFVSEVGADFDSAPVSLAGPFAVEPASPPASATLPFAAPATGTTVPDSGLAVVLPPFAVPVEAGPAQFAQPQLVLPESGPVESTVGASPDAALVPQAAVEAPAEAVEPMAHANDQACAPIQPQVLHVAQEVGPVSRIASAELGELSPVELIERMALSLQRRRAALEAAVSVTAPAASTGTLAAILAAAPAPQVLQPAAPQPPVTEPALPAAEMPAPEATASLALPAALRPIDFAEYEEDDNTPIPAPPRSIAMPAPVLAPAAPAAPAAPFAAPFTLPYPTEESADEETVAENAAEAGNQDVPEDNYSSLLDIGRPTEQRQQFIRIDEPEADSDAVEPVVIFPGRSARAESRFDVPGQVPPEPQPEVAPAAPGGDRPQHRRFDAPEADQDPGIVIPARDPAETERALRSALATLQRMSGAA